MSPVTIISVISISPVWIQLTVGQSLTGYTAHFIFQTWMRSLSVELSPCPTLPPPPSPPLSSLPPSPTNARRQPASGFNPLRRDPWVLLALRMNQAPRFLLTLRIHQTLRLLMIPQILQAIQFLMTRIHLDPRRLPTIRICQDPLAVLAAAHERRQYENRNEPLGYFCGCFFFVLFCLSIHPRTIFFIQCRSTYLFFSPEPSSFSTDRCYRPGLRMQGL